MKARSRALTAFLAGGAVLILAACGSGASAGSGSAAGSGSGSKSGAYVSSVSRTHCLDRSLRMASGS